MISAGNDIVALNAIDVARTKLPRFYSKILSDAELALFNQQEFAAISFEIFVWLLWSIKESAYKFMQRLDAGLIFTPVKVEVKQLAIPTGFTVNDFNKEELTAIGFNDMPVLKGIVSIAGTELHSRSLIYNSFILSVVNSNNNFDNICWGVKTISDSDPDAQSAEVRKFLNERLQNTAGFQDLVISKNTQGIPVLLSDKTDMVLPVSLSHHHQLISYSFQLNN